MTLRLFSIIVLALVCAAVRADDVPTFMLPEDGAWAKYRVTSTRTRGDRTLHDEMELTLSSVGKETRDGKACRWLEVVSKEKDAAGNELRGIVNVLIPEDAFQSKDHPLRMLVEGKHRRPRNRESVKLDWESATDSPLMVFLPGPLEDRKKLEDRTLSSPDGEIACTGTQGRYSLESERRGTLTVTRSAWVHSKAPFGVVRAELRLKQTRDGRERDMGELTLELIEQGVGATRQLP